MDSLNSKLGTNPGILQGVWVVGISGAPHFLITSQSDQKNNTLVSWAWPVQVINIQITCGQGP